MLLHGRARGFTDISALSLRRCGSSGVVRIYQTPLNAKCYSQCLHKLWLPGHLWVTQTFHQLTIQISGIPKNIHRSISWMTIFTAIIAQLYIVLRALLKRQFFIILKQSPFKETVGDYIFNESHCHNCSKVINYIYSKRPANFKYLFWTTINPPVFVHLLTILPCMISNL